MTMPFVGPWPPAPVPEQPSFEGHCVAWTAFDVPRIWDIVAAEDNPRGWEQTSGFRQLADLLLDYHRRLGVRRFELANAWHSPAASEMLYRVNTFAESLLSDAHCAQSTAYALHNIMTIYADARTKIDNVHGRWNDITNDWIPEWWDHVAEELNAEAQTIMVKTDDAVRDYRKRILAPRLYYIGLDESIALPMPSASEVAERADIRVPPVPGHDPWNGLVGPDLASTTSQFGFIPAVPGQPVSMLPILPGNQYAPLGGAYVLPGPGVGRTGYLVPLRQNEERRGARYRQEQDYGGRRSTGPLGNQHNLSRGHVSTSGAGPSGFGVLPTTVGTPTSSAGGAEFRHNRRPNTVWPIGEGVPSVIEGIADDTSTPFQSDQQQEDAFKEWFAELAYPWRSEAKTSAEPHIVLRKVAG